MKFKKIKFWFKFLLIIIISSIIVLKITEQNITISEEKKNEEIQTRQIRQSEEQYFDEIYNMIYTGITESKETEYIQQISDIEPHIDESTGVKYVTYEDFGAKSDDGYDNYQAIKNTHDYANQNNYEVRATSQSYNIYKLEDLSPIMIKTDTDWNNAKFIIHDEDINNRNTRNYAIFQIVSNEQNTIITDKNILNNIQLNKQTKKVNQLAGYGECLCIAYNHGKIQYIRSGGNQNSGAIQRDIFRIDNEGNLLNEIQWNFDNISQITIIPIPDDTITVKNGDFETILPEENYEQTSGYLNRNITCSRSNTIIENINHVVNNNEYIGGPYFGFVKLSYVCDVTLKDSSLYSHKYETKSNYDLIVECSCNINIINVTSNNIDDTQRWGITGTNYTKDITYENCVLNRIDAHTGVHNLTINNCTIGVKGLTLTGSGELNLNNVTRTGGNYLIELRSDYGSTWDGNINIKDCTLQGTSSNRLIYFKTTYDDGVPHDYGYDLYLPNVYIDRLNIQDETISANYDNIYVFYNGSNETGTDNGDMRNNYNLPQNIIIRNYKTTSGRKLKLFYNKFYNSLEELGINLSMPLSDKEEVSIMTSDNEIVENNLITNKDIKIIKNDVEGIETIIKVNGNLVKNDANETISDEGNYIFEITYKNTAEEIETKNISVTIDKTAPKITGADDDMIYYKTITLNSTDTDIREINVYKNDKKIEYSLGKEISEAGNYTIEVNDYAGNTNTIKFEIALEFESNDENYYILGNYILVMLDNNKLEQFVEIFNANVDYEVYRDEQQLTSEQTIQTGDFIVTENENEYYLIVRGDSNKDGYADITDLLFLKRYLLKMITFDEYSEKAMDLNNDDIVDITDLLLMRRLLLE